MKLYRWTLLLAMAVFLSACGNNTTPTPTMTLTPTPAQVVSGGTTVLEATFDDASSVASVEFGVKDGAGLPADTTSEDGFKATSLAITANTTFVATAKDEGGATLATAEASVTLSAVQQPRAADKAVTTLAGVAVVGGKTATGLAVTTDKLVFENGTPQKVAGSETGGVAVVDPNGDFTFTPAAGFVGAASFKYRVGSAEGTVTVTVKALPANTSVASSLDAINAAPEGATLLWSGEVTCEADQDPSATESHCVLLKPNQKLLGSGEVDGVRLSNPNAKLRINLAGTNTDAITAIKLEDGVTIEGLEISGEGSELFTAIRGRAVELGGVITIRNVTIAGETSNAPFAIRFVDGDIFGSYYTLNVEGLRVTNARFPIGLSAFSSVTFRNSTIAMDVEYALSVREFGLSFHAYGDATATVDNVDITSAKANPEFAPMKFAQSSGGGRYDITVSNNDVSFGDGVDLATANAYFINYGNAAATTGKIVINAASRGNTAEASSTGATRFSVAGGGAISSRIEGQLEVNGQLLPSAP